MSTFEELFGSLPIEHRPTKKVVLSAKQKVLRKMDADLETLKGMSDVDDLGYGTKLYPYTNKKGKEVFGRMKSWSGSVASDGKREVRMVLGQSIVFFQNKTVEVRVGNSIKEVEKGLKALRDVAEGLSETKWEEVATQMAEINQQRRKQKKANKQS